MMTVDKARRSLMDQLNQTREEAQRLREALAAPRAMADGRAPLPSPLPTGGAAVSPAVGDLSTMAALQPRRLTLSGHSGPGVAGEAGAAVGAAGVMSAPAAHWSAPALDAVLAQVWSQLRQLLAAPLAELHRVQAEVRAEDLAHDGDGGGDGGGDTSSGLVSAPLGDANPVNPAGREGRHGSPALAMAAAAASAPVASPTLAAGSTPTVSGPVETPSHRGNSETGAQGLGVGPRTASPAMQQQLRWRRQRRHALFKQWATPIAEGGKGTGSGSGSGSGGGGGTTAAGGSNATLAPRTLRLRGRWGVRRGAARDGEGAIEGGGEGLADGGAAAIAGANVPPKTRTAALLCVQLGSRLREVMDGTLSVVHLLPCLMGFVDRTVRGGGGGGGGGSGCVVRHCSRPDNSWV